VISKSKKLFENLLRVETLFPLQTTELKFGGTRSLKITIFQPLQEILIQLAYRIEYRSPEMLSSSITGKWLCVTKITEPKFSF
jgi:hypothetical protein